MNVSSENTFSFTIPSDFLAKMKTQPGLQSDSQRKSVFFCPAIEASFPHHPARTVYQVLHRNTWHIQGDGTLEDSSALVPQAKCPKML